LCEIVSSHRSGKDAAGVQGSMKSHLAWLCGGLMLLSGCSWFDSLTVRSQSPEDIDEIAAETKLVGDLAVPFGMHPIRIESVGLLTGLHGTGSDPGPCPQRSRLVDEMKVRGVKNPNAVLGSRNVALVLVQGYLRPGIRAGDPFDVEVRVPSRSETSSLRGGYLLEARMTELAALADGFIHPGHELATAKGSVLVDPSSEGRKDSAGLTHGRILGGGIAKKNRDLGLVLKNEYQTVYNTSRIANAVNRRFHTYDKGVQIGVAKAKTHQFIELVVHPRYKDNVARYVHVVRAMAIQETEMQRAERIVRLEKKLLQPETACEAALQLEAIGKPGCDVLIKAIQSKNPEVRFYAAEALAYLDRREAAEPLGELARNEPAFRVFALTALSTMADYTAYEQLRDLLDVPSAETRYGAFRALCAMNPNDGLVAGERLGDQFSYHVLDAAALPMIHVTRNRRPEVVLFGREQRFLAPLALNAGPQIMVTGANADEIAVSKYAVGESDQKRIVSTRIDEVIRTVVELGGTYPDVVQLLQEAKAANVLTTRFEVDALPEAGRTIERLAADGKKGTADEGETGSVPESPAPDLFQQKAGKKSSAGGDSAAEGGKSAAAEPDSAKKPSPVSRFFAKIAGRGSD
jgi:flagellar basal body P-ring protein FlgI